MAVSYKPLMHMMIERDISNAELMRRAKISANIITKIKNGQYIALDKVESICSAMSCTPNDMMEFIPDQPKEKIDYVMGMEYLYQFKGIHYLEQFYDVEHLLPIDDTLESLQSICQKNGGNLK